MCVQELIKILMYVEGKKKIHNQMSTREIRYIYLAISPYIGSIGAYSVLPVTLQSCRHLCGTIYFTWCLQDSIVMYLVSRGVTDYRDCGQHVRELALDLEHCIEE